MEQRPHNTEKIMCIGHILIYITIMIVGAIIGGTLGAAGGELGSLLGSYFGVGICPFIVTVIDYFLVTLPKLTWDTSMYRLKHEGIIAGLFQFVLGPPIYFLFFTTPKLCILFLISPVIAIYRFMRAIFQLLMRGSVFYPDLWYPLFKFT